MGGVSRWCSTRAGIVLAICVMSTSTAAESPAPGVRLQNFRGWDDCLSLEVSGVQAIIAPAVGGRILHYSATGENILWENPSGFGKTLGSHPSGFGVGGYQCDLGPELRGIPPHDALWIGRHRWSAPGPYQVTVESEHDLGVGVQLAKQIVMEPGTGDLGITQIIRNLSDREVSFCLWDRTLCKNDGFAFFPLNRKSRFKAGWSLRRGASGHYTYDGDTPASPNVRVMGGVLVARCNGEATKVGADSDAGWIAYARGRLLFVKYFPWFANGDYTDGGNSVELYFDPRVAELEPLSPEVKLPPGGQYAFPEKWTLIELKAEALTFEQARALVKLIPPSPFKR